VPLIEFPLIEFLVLDRAKSLDARVKGLSVTGSNR
jgi:hypothetical protein